MTGKKLNKYTFNHEVNVLNLYFSKSLKENVDKFPLSVCYTNFSSFAHSFSATRSLTNCRFITKHLNRWLLQFPWLCLKYQIQFNTFISKAFLERKKLISDNCFYHQYPLQVNSLHLGLEDRTLKKMLPSLTTGGIKLEKKIGKV